MVTVAVEVVGPPALVAVNVYVVVTTGVTTMLVPVTVPIPLSTETVVAPVTDQASVEEPPRAMVEGVAVKEAITGTGSSVTSTVAVAVTGPEAFVAVNV